MSAPPALGAASALPRANNTPQTGTVLPAASGGTQGSDSAPGSSGAGTATQGQQPVLPSTPMEDETYRAYGEAENVLKFLLDDCHAAKDVPPPERLAHASAVMVSWEGALAGAHARHTNTLHKAAVPLLRRWKLIAPEAHPTGATSLHLTAVLMEKGADLSRRARCGGHGQPRWRTRLCL